MIADISAVPVASAKWMFARSAAAPWPAALKYYYRILQWIALGRAKTERLLPARISQ
jgi:hypothetical protein